MPFASIPCCECALTYSVFKVLCAVDKKIQINFSFIRFVKGYLSLQAGLHALHVYCQVDSAFLSLVFDALQNRQTRGFGRRTHARGSEDVLTQTEQQSPE